MSALTTERLDEIEQDPIEACLTDNEIIELVAAARSNAKLVEALKDIGRQKLRTEMTAEEVESADIEFGYDTCIHRARAALEAAGVKP